MGNSTTNNRLLAPREEIDLLIVDVLKTTINRKIESIYWQLEFLV
jgi:hypothetical protein